MCCCLHLSSSLFFSFFNFSRFPLSCAFLFSRLSFLDADVLSTCFFLLPHFAPESYVKNNQQTFTELISDHHSFVLYRIWLASSSEQRPLAAPQGELNLFCRSRSTMMLYVVQIMLVAGRGESAVLGTSA